MNTMILDGRIGRDPEVKHLSDTVSVVRFSLAVSTRIKKGQEWSERTDWIDVECWGHHGQNAIAHLVKGCLVVVVGSFKIDKWTGRDGAERSKPVCYLSGPDHCITRKDLPPREANQAPAPRREPLDEWTPPPSPAPHTEDDLPF